MTGHLKIFFDQKHLMLQNPSDQMFTEFQLNKPELTGCLNLFTGQKYIYWYILIYLFVNYSTYHNPALSYCPWPPETWLYSLVEHISTAPHQFSGSQTCFQSLTFVDISQNDSEMYKWLK